MAGQSVGCSSAPHSPAASSSARSMRCAHLLEAGSHQEAKGCCGQADHQEQQEGEAKGVARELQQQVEEQRIVRRD